MGVDALDCTSFHSFRPSGYVSEIVVRTADGILKAAAFLYEKETRREARKTWAARRPAVMRCESARR
jgi:hypothetical protein